MKGYWWETTLRKIEFGEEIAFKTINSVDRIAVKNMNSIHKALSVGSNCQWEMAIKGKVAIIGELVFIGEITLKQNSGNSNKQSLGTRDGTICTAQFLGRGISPMCSLWKSFSHDPYLRICWTWGKEMETDIGGDGESKENHLNRDQSNGQKTRVKPSGKYV